MSKEHKKGASVSTTSIPPASVDLPSFPTTVMLLDTGQRRYPLPGEWYYWRDDGGTVHGPNNSDKLPPGAGEWVSDADRYAIYDITHIFDKSGVN